MDVKYTVYKIVNKINGKIYIGCHKTYDLDDGYMGSGLLIKRAIKKYGVENFEKEILEVFNNPSDMFYMEAKLVNLNDPNGYNLKEGGFGGFDYINNNPEKFLTEKRLNSLMSAKDRQKLWRKKYDNDPEFRFLIRENAKLGNKKLQEKYPEGTFKGMHHTEESKQKIAKGATKRLGANNGSFGTMWITNNHESKKISKNDPIPDGWRKGRKIK